MSEPPADPDAAAERAIARLDGFARGLGLDDLTVRLIVEAVIAGTRPHAHRGGLI